jgi:hypothetical protein
MKNAKIKSFFSLLLIFSLLFGISGGVRVYAADTSAYWNGFKRAENEVLEELLQTIKNGSSQTGLSSETVKQKTVTAGSKADIEDVMIIRKEILNPKEIGSYAVILGGSIGKTAINGEEYTTAQAYIYSTGEIANIASKHSDWVSAGNVVALGTNEMSSSLARSAVSYFEIAFQIDNTLANTGRENDYGGNGIANALKSGNQTQIIGTEGDLTRISGEINLSSYQSGNSVDFKSGERIKLLPGSEYKVLYVKDKDGSAFDIADPATYYVAESTGGTANRAGLKGITDSQFQYDGDNRQIWAVAITDNKGTTLSITFIIRNPQAGGTGSAIENDANVDWQEASGEKTASVSSYGIVLDAVGSELIGSARYYTSKAFEIGRAHV